MNDKSACFVIPTYRLREVGETVAHYDDHFWRNGHSVPIVVFDDSSAVNHAKYYSLLEEAVHVIKGSLELWPTLIEICYFQKGRKGLPQTLVGNRRHAVRPRETTPARREPREA